MPAKYIQLGAEAPAPSTMQADERQVKNSAGGFVFEVSPEQRLRRFLVLGTEGGTFYVGERELTKASALFLKRYAQQDPGEMSSILSEVDRENVAPRHTNLLYAFAILYTETSGSDAYGWMVERLFHQLVRTGTHLFEFVDYVNSMRGWGRNLRRLVSSWYTTQEPSDLAYQLVKYRQRAGWTHRDVLRKAHPKVGKDEDNRRNLKFAVTGEVDPFAEPILQEFVATQKGLPAGATRFVPWEGLPTESLKDPVTWQHLLDQKRLPFTAMVRNLGRMTSIGVFKDSATLALVLKRLRDADEIRRSRQHPFNLLNAQRTYVSGGGFRGKLTWTPITSIVDALDSAYQASYGFVEPTGKRILIALDVSGSMGEAILNSSVTAREGAGAMALATLAADGDTTDVVGFTAAPSDRSYGYGRSLPQVFTGSSRGWMGAAAGLSLLDLSPRRRLDDNLRAIDNLEFGATDASMPVRYAASINKAYDAFVIYTDSETWAGDHLADHLKDYRQRINADARLVVVGMTATGFTVNDPADRLGLDVVGFDASAPKVISNFISGKF